MKSRRKGVKAKIIIENITMKWNRIKLFADSRVIALVESGSITEENTKQEIIDAVNAA